MCESNRWQSDETQARRQAISAYSRVRVISRQRPRGRGEMARFDRMPTPSVHNRKNCEQFSLSIVWIIVSRVRTWIDLVHKYLKKLQQFSTMSAPCEPLIQSQMRVISKQCFCRVNEFRKLELSFCLNRCSSESDRFLQASWKWHIHSSYRSKNEDYKDSVHWSREMLPSEWQLLF